MIDRYLARLGLTSRPAATLAGLIDLQLRHLVHIPFENLDVFMQRPVSTDPATSMRKIVEGGRGGWCFELNGAYAELLRSLGFDVRVLGAATLFDGPSDLVDHMLLEVVLDQPYLVDVGFGRHSPIEPIPLHAKTHTIHGQRYEFVPSPKGTTLALHVADALTPLCRFKRVAHTHDEFAGASERLQADATSVFRRSPFATRLISGTSRLTLSAHKLTIEHLGQAPASEPVTSNEWLGVLAEKFGISNIDHHYRHPATSSNQSDLDT